MIKNLLCFAASIALASFGLRAQSAEDLGKIKFTGIASIKVVTENNVRYALVKAEVANHSNSEILIADGSYNITFQRAGKPFLKLPFARPAGESVLPKGSMMSAGKGTITFAVTLGDTGAATTDEVLVPLFNLIGSDDGVAAANEEGHAVTLVLDGKIRYGVKVGEATVFRNEEIRWSLVPKPLDHLIFTK